MQEYKREKASLETRLKETSKAATYHDDHLRIIDSWYNQVSICPTFPSLLVSVLTLGTKVDRRSQNPFGFSKG